MGSGRRTRSSLQLTAQPSRPSVAELDPPRALAWLTPFSSSGRGTTRDVQLPLPVPTSPQQETAWTGPYCGIVSQPLTDTLRTTSAT
jgi:hypothetical protein